MSKYSVHRCRLYNPSPGAINAISIENSLKKLAVGRSDGSLEIWDVKDNFTRELIFPPVQNSSIESLIWCKKRLFSSGFDGFLREYSFHKLFPVSEVKVSASAVWCLTKNPTETHLAVGTEDGAVSLYSVDDEEKVQFEKNLVHVEKRIISLAYHEDGIIIAGGSIDSIRIWNVENGRCLLRISVPRRIANVETLVWSVSFGKDMVLISGDSEGRTSFWNCQNGTLINSFESHKADVLCVISDKANNRFYSSGIDPSICQFVQIDEKIDISDDFGDIRPVKRLKNDADRTRTSFIEGTRRNIHSHDVRSMALMDEWLISGGVDTFINLSKYPPNTISRVPPFDANRVQFACKGALSMFQNEKQCEIWSLGSSNEPAGDKNGEILKLDKKPLKLAEIKSKDDEWILCGSIDNDGKYYANSDGKRTNLYHILLKNSSYNSKPEVNINRVKCLNGNIPGGSSLCFASRPNCLIVATTNSFCLFNIDEVLCKFDEEIKFQGDFLVRKMSANLNSTNLIAVMTSENDVFVLNLDEKRIVSTLPRHDFSPVDVRFSTMQDDLIVMYSNGSLIEYSTELCKYTSWSRLCLSGLNLNMNWISPPLGISLSYQNFDEIFVYGASQLFLLKKNESEKDNKKSESKSKIWWKENKNFKFLCRFSSLHDGDVVAVEIDNENYLKRLPPTLKVRKFGTG